MFFIFTKVKNIFRKFNDFEIDLNFNDFSRAVGTLYMVCIWPIALTVVVRFDSNTAEVTVEF